MLGLSGPFVADNRGGQSPNSGVLNIHHIISAKDSISGRYLQGDGYDEFPAAGLVGGGSQLNPWFGVTPTVASNFAISEVHVFNPNLINTVRLGWNRFSQFQKGRDASEIPPRSGSIRESGRRALASLEVDSAPLSKATQSLRAFSRIWALQNGAGGRVATTYQVADDFKLDLARKNA